MHFCFSIYKYGFMMTIMCTVVLQDISITTIHNTCVIIAAKISYYIMHKQYQRITYAKKGIRVCIAPSKRLKNQLFSDVPMCVS